jgi:hypothetical protein
MCIVKANAQHEYAIAGLLGLTLINNQAGNVIF